MSDELLDCLGRRRSPPTSAFHAGRTPRNAGLRYPADPPPVEEIVAVMRAAGPGAYGDRLRGIIVVLWRAGLRVGEALALAETDLDPSRGSVLIRRGKGGKRREVGMDGWGWRQLEPWLEYRRQLPVGPLFLRSARPQPRPPLGARRGPSGAAPRRRPGRGAPPAGAPSAPPRPRRRDGPRGVPLVVIQRQLGHAHLGITRSICRALTTPKSSTPSTTAPRQSYPPAPACARRDGHYPPDDRFAAGAILLAPAAAGRDSVGCDRPIG
jgi:hypothetical protein